MTSTKGCSVDDCSGSHKGRGLCEKHLVRLRRTGSTELVPAVLECRECGGPTPPTRQDRAYCSRKCADRANGRLYYQRHGEEVREKSRVWGASEQGQNRTLLRRYGITLDQREAMRAAQDGHCLFCESTVLFVDHCHDSGRIRGLLCRGCNSLIGRIGDGDPEKMNKFLHYLGLAETYRLEDERREA